MESGLLFHLAYPDNCGLNCALMPRSRRPMVRKVLFHVLPTGSKSWLNARYSVTGSLFSSPQALWTDPQFVPFLLEGGYPAALERCLSKPSPRHWPRPRERQISLSSRQWQTSWPVSGPAKPPPSRTSCASASAGRPLLRYVSHFSPLRSGLLIYRTCGS